MGVRRAMNIVLDAANKKSGKLYTHGPLVHNPQAIEMLKQKGVEVLGDKSVSNETVIVRAHGITPDERRKIKESGNLLCDATCPHVARAQAIIRREIRKGYNAIIVGDKGHAEVNGLLGFTEGRGVVVEGVKDISALPELDKACVIAQTTQERKIFNEVVEQLQPRIPDLKVYDTICDSTSMRQKEVSELAKEVDAVVVVGGKNSANTRRLYEISHASGVPSFHIEEESELEGLGLEGYENIGVMAGASTPNWVIDKVIYRIKYLLKKRKSALSQFLENAGNFIVDSSLYLSVGAVAMCYASLVFQGIEPSATILSIAFFYVFSTHVFNRYNERLKDEFSDPARNMLFKKFGKVLIASAVVASFTSLYLSYLLGTAPFLFLLFSYFMGILYTIRIIPAKLQPFFKYKRLKDVPGSKDIFIAVAWVWVLVLIPIMQQHIYFSYKAATIMGYVFLTVFIRSVVFDIVSIEGDRIVGRETIPILIGQKRTLAMLFVISIMTAVFILTSAAFDLIPSLGYYLILPPAVMVVCLYFFQKKRIPPSTLFEAMIDSNFLFAGLIAYLWQKI